MKAIPSRPRTLLLAAFAAGLVAAAGPLAAQQAPAVNPDPPGQPPIPPSAQPGAGPGSQPLVSPAPPQAAAPGPAAQAPPPPSWAQGRPENPAVADIAPVQPPPIATAADKLPQAKLKLPPNFNIEVYASGLTNARSLRIGDKGTVFVSTRLLNRVYAVTEKSGKREVKTLATDLNSPNGIAFHNGTLYIAEINKISKNRRCREQARQPAEADRHL